MCSMAVHVHSSTMPYPSLESPNIYLGIVPVLFKIRLGTYCGIVLQSLAQPPERSSRVRQLERVAEQPKSYGAGLQRAMAPGSKELIKIPEVSRGALPGALGCLCHPGPSFPVARCKPGVPAVQKSQGRKWDIQLTESATRVFFIRDEHRFRG